MHAQTKHSPTDVAVVVHRHAAHIHADAVALAGTGPESLLLPGQGVVQLQLRQAQLRAFVGHARVARHGHLEAAAQRDV
jgi:hypothetical protein